jgi:hypothetical protein
MCGWKAIALDQGPAAFDHLAAELYSGGTEFVVDTGYGTAHEYMVYGTGLSKSQIVAYAAAMRAVGWWGYEQLVGQTLAEWTGVLFRLLR